MWLFVTYVGNIYFSHFILKLSPILIQLSGQFFVVVRLTLLSLLGLIQCFDSCLVFLFGLFGSCLYWCDEVHLPSLSLNLGLYCGTSFLLSIFPVCLYLALFYVLTIVLKALWIFVVMPLLILLMKFFCLLSVLIC